MIIVNMSSVVESVKIVSKDGNLDYITVMPKRKVTIPEGFVVDSNWSATHPLIKTVADTTEA
jgi:hypothetical protein